MRPRYASNPVGRRFGEWTVLEDLGVQPYGEQRYKDHMLARRQRRVLVRCVCGIERDVVLSKLTTGHNRSCGCTCSRWVGTRVRGLTIQHRAEYKPWSNMWRRCTVPTDRAYARYGGRGIGVCERWKDFEVFLADVGPRPTGTTIDRIDNDGHYEPGNVRWTTATAQANNRRSNLVIEWNGEHRTLEEWSRITGIPRPRLGARYRNGFRGDRLFDPHDARR